MGRINGHGVAAAAATIMACGALALSACGGDAEGVSSGGNADPTAGTGGDGGAGGAAGSAGVAAGHGGDDVGRELPLSNLCAETPPEGSARPAAPPGYSGGSCPTLMPGVNPMGSGGVDREFTLLVPSEIGSDERLPIVFFWHWLGGDMDDFVQRGELEAAVNQQRFIAVVPASIPTPVSLYPALDLKWPYDITQSAARMEQEFVFFDDMLSCVVEQYSTNTDCVSSVGVSSGALFTDQLAAHRSRYLANFLSLSGGVGTGQGGLADVIKPWKGAEHKLPGLVLWGGDSDNCFNLLKFKDQSQALENALEADGHFFLECVHNCGHAQPPIDSPDGMSVFAPLWQFIFDHPYWLEPGESPYIQHGLPEGFPLWCGVGKASAVQRTGVCVDDSQC